MPSSLQNLGAETNSQGFILSWKPVRLGGGTWIAISIFVAAFLVIPLVSLYFVPPTMADAPDPAVAAALNDSDEDAAGLAALKTLEPSSDPAVAAALNDSDEDAACLAAMNDPASSAFTLSDSDEDAACLEALEAAEAEQ